MASEAPIPTELNYQRSTRVLELSFTDGAQFSLTAEYLRVHSPSAEVRGHGPGQEVLQVGKELVAIADIKPVGNYAVCLRFDDGHDTGIYSWDELYDLGQNQERYWTDYLRRLEEAGHRRREDSY